MYQEDAEHFEHQRELVAIEDERRRGTGQIDLKRDDWLPELIPCPQHKDATERCLFCGEKDGRTLFGALYCADCVAAGVQGTVPVRQEVHRP